MKIHTLQKVTFEYNDTIEVLEDGQAEDWLKNLNSQLTLGWVHGNEFPEYKWKVTKKK